MDQPDYDSVASDEDTEKEPTSGKDERTKVHQDFRWVYSSVCVWDQIELWSLLSELRIFRLVGQPHHCAGVHGSEKCPHCLRRKDPTAPQGQLPSWWGVETHAEQGKQLDHTSKRFPFLPYRPALLNTSTFDELSNSAWCLRFSWTPSKMRTALWNGRLLTVWQGRRTSRTGHLHVAVGPCRCMRPARV